MEGNMTLTPKQQDVLNRLNRGKSPLTPEQQKAWQDKVMSGEPGIVVDDSKPRYYTRSFPGANVYRVLPDRHEYAYLDHESGNWIPHPAVCDAVTGYRGDADTREITEKQAQALIRRYTRGSK